MIKFFRTIWYILQAIVANEKVVQETPKTLSVKEGLFLDSLKRDFPEINIDLVKSYVNEIVADYLNCLETGITKELEKDCTENFVVQAKSRTNGKPYRNLKFHRTVINDYRRNGREAVILFQTACQYTISKKMIQTRFETKYIYYLKETEHNLSKLLRCSYCGGPVVGIGQKVCKYCGHGIVDTIKKTWKFSDIREF